MKAPPAVTVSMTVAIAIGAVVTVVVVTRSSSLATDAARLELPMPNEETAPPSVRAAAPVDAPHVTFLPEPCLLSIEVDGRVVYRGKPRCKNPAGAVEIAVPRARAARIRTTSAAHYAGAGVWVEHEDELVMPLVPRRYVVGEGYAIFEHASTPTMHGAHCVSVTSASPRYTSWIASHFGDRDGPYEMGHALLIGHENNERALTVIPDDAAREHRTTRYLRLVPGTYHFHVDRRGRITLAYEAVVRCR